MSSRWHCVKSLASFPTVKAGAKGRNMRKANQRGFCFNFFRSERRSGVRRIKDQDREGSWEPGSWSGKTVDREAEERMWVR